MNAALFLDNPVRTVRPVLVTRPNLVPTIILLLYYTVCLFYTARPTYIVARLHAETATVYHESSQHFDASINLSSDMGTTAYFIKRDGHLVCVMTWLKNTTDVLFNNTFFTLLSNAWFGICDH